MTTDTAKKILEYIKNKKQVTVKDLVENFEISPQAIFKHLHKFLENNEIDKVGKPPRVFYFAKGEVPSSEKTGNKDAQIDKFAKKIIEENFTIITPAGERKEGLDGFTFWCKKTNQPIAKTAREYMDSWKKFNAFKLGGFIDGMHKIKKTFQKVYLDGIFYLDFYSIERFGKTKLGQSLLYAKQSQDKLLIKELILDVKPSIEKLIKKYKITAIGFIPPTVKRQVQFMKELEKNINCNLQKIEILKAKTEISVPQKTLSHLEDRIENAQKTIFVMGNQKHENILLIDDAVGSGATLNETAGQIKSKGFCKGKIIGLAITGSFKGFDVISEV